MVCDICKLQICSEGYEGYVVSVIYFIVWGSEIGQIILFDVIVVDFVIMVVQIEVVW